MLNTGDAMKQKGIVLWFTGLPCSGKTSISKGLHARLSKDSLRSYVLDGDVIRKGLCADLGFTESDRHENIRRIGEVSRLFADSGQIIIVAFISPFRQDRDRVRNILKSDQFVEVYVDCPMEVCEQRDVKGMYKKALNGEIKNFTGVSSPYEPPLNPEIHLETHKLSLEECVDEVYKYLT